MQQTKPKLIFIGRAYHAKTKSDELILALLRRHYEVIIIRRDGLDDREIVREVNTQKPLAVVFWCLPPSFTFHLLKFKCKNIIWAPMWDGFKPLSWKKKIIFSLYNVKVLCFSKVLYNYFKKTPLKCMHAQCFLKPDLKPLEKNEGPYTFFLWQREKDIAVDPIVSMIGEKNIKKLLYKTEIGEQPRKDYSFEIEELPDWLPKEKYQAKIDEADFFIAPRKSEGIGFSFLEPMSRGLVILAYDNATMNEYIEDGVTGYLFGDNFKLKGAIRPPKSLSRAIEAKTSELYHDWETRKENIIPFIEGEKGVAR